MNEKFVAAAIAELIEAHNQSLKLLTTAIAKQLHAQQLTVDIQNQITTAQTLGGLSTLAESMLKHAMPAARTVGLEQGENPAHSRRGH